jgi:hypothetical protein
MEHSPFELQNGKNGLADGTMELGVAIVACSPALAEGK